MSALDQNCDFSAEVDESEGGGGEDERGVEFQLEPAFDEFYREHYAFVWRCARRMLGGASDDQVEDVIQDTFLAAYRRFDSYDGACRPTTWLFGILRNVARNHSRGERRRARRVTAFAAFERDREHTREADPSLLLARPLLEAFLRTLDPEKRAVFVLAELEGASGREIAAALDINPNTAHSRLRAARRQFCTHFDLPPSREQVSAQTGPLRERPEQPSHEARARSRALFVAGLGKTSLAASGGGLGLAALGKGLVAKLAITAGALVLAGLGLGLSQTELEKAPPAAELAVGHAPELRSPSLASVALADTNEPPQPIPVVALAPQHPSKPLAQTRAQPNAYELVRRARQALVDDRPTQALELLASIPGSSSTLRGQRAATEIAALCRLERGSQAKVVAQRFAAAEPDSPLLARIDHACW